MILITGAGGKTGRAIVQALAAKIASQQTSKTDIRATGVRALVRRQDQIDELLAVGASNAVIADLAIPADLAEACKGVSQIYLICPNMHADEVALAQNVLTAAQSANVQRIVYHSVLHPQTEKMPHHWNKLRVEEMLFESGIPYTILQPAAYMQNVLASWSAIVADGVYRVPYSVTTRLGMVDLVDIAEAAATVLLGDTYIYGTYELCGPQVLDQTDVARLIGQQINQPVRAEKLDHDTWSRGAQQAGLSDRQIDWLLKMFDYYEQFGFWGNPTALTQILGREPNTFEHFLQQNT